MATEAKWGKAEAGVVIGAGLAWLAGMGLPDLLSKIPMESDAPPHPVLVFVALLVAFSAAVALWHLLDGFWMRRIEDRPTSRVRSMAAGAVELAGRAGPASLVSPLSGHACVYWDYGIWLEGRDDELIQVCFRNSAAWPVALCDETGSVWIDTRGGEVVPSQSEMTRVRRGRSADPATDHFRQLHAVSDGPLQIQERWIEPGDPLFLHGASRPRHETEATRERVAKLRDASRQMEEREDADPSVVAQMALSCASSLERRRSYEHELEARIAARPRDAGALDESALATLRVVAREASDRALVGKRRRFARWFLTASEGKEDPAELAVAAHVFADLASPDQALLVARDPDAGVPLDLTCMSEVEILDRHRRFRAQMMRGGSILAAGGFVLGALGSGAPFVVLTFGAFCFAFPTSVAMGCAIRTQWIRKLLRLQLPTAQERFPS